MNNLPFMTVISPGMMSTIQDRGRTGLSKYGFSPSGAADLTSLRLANLLVSNHPDEACVEMCISGMIVKFSGDCTVSITGAFMNPRLNGYPIEQNAAINIKDGDYLNHDLLGYPNEYARKLRQRAERRRPAPGCRLLCL